MDRAELNSGVVFQCTPLVLLQMLRRILLCTTAVLVEHTCMKLQHDVGSTSDVLTTDGKGDDVDTQQVLQLHPS